MRLGPQPRLFRISHLGQLVFGQDRPSLLVLRLQEENGTMEAVLKDGGTGNQNPMQEMLLKGG